MIRNLSNSFWFFIAIGVFGLVLDPSASNRFFFQAYTAFLKLYLLGFSAFLVFKQLQLYQIRKDSQLIRLSHRSDHQNVLMWQGLVLFLLFMVYQRVYHLVLSGDTVLLCLLLFYYLAQVHLHSTPTFYIGKERIYYDDYFLSSIQWADIEQLMIRDGELLIQANNREMILDLASIDQFDQDKISTEIDFSVLDGAIASERSSRSIVDVLQEFAQAHGLEIRTQA
jgi:hypothetical protein